MHFRWRVLNCVRRLESSRKPVITDFVPRCALRVKHLIEIRPQLGDSRQYDGRCDVDFENEFHLWVTAIEWHDSSSHLVGLAFNGTSIGVLTTKLDVLERPIWIATASAPTRLECRLFAAHYSRSGWSIVAESNVPFPVPCLLSSNPSVRLIFHGRVRAQLLNVQGIGMREFVGTATSLIGAEWFGVILPSEEGYSLIAFGDGTTRRPAKCKRAILTGATDLIPHFLRC